MTPCCPLHETDAHVKKFEHIRLHITLYFNHKVFLKGMGNVQMAIVILAVSKIERVSILAIWFNIPNNLFTADIVELFLDSVIIFNV